MPYVQSGSVTVHFRPSRTRGPVLLLAHGFLMDESMFEPLRKPLTAAGINVVTWDARGHGGTRAPRDEPFTYWDLAGDALTVLNALGVEKAVIGGMSQGGYVALRTALLAPERVLGLALLDTEASACSLPELAQYRAFFDAWCGQDPLAPITETLAPQLIGGPDPAAWTQWTTRWQAGDRLAIRAAAECLMTRDSVLRRLHEIEVPALVLRGSHDASSTAAKSAALAAGLPGASGVITVPDAGHGAAWTHPELVAPALLQLMCRATYEPKDSVVGAGTGHGVRMPRKNWTLPG
ncbi:alpha/beta fold hydrolase [Nocardia sp. GCM10030253]|uniref:alpha/beta fold hydrolase n=1 Tax=Nocardia sp. GCM10030253 TaxID=3273404 RepID=UPI00363DE10D